MKITAIQDLHAASGTGHFSFLKITTDAGLIGWAEFNEGSGSKALSTVIQANGAQLIGKDPLPVQKIATQLYQQTVQAPGGMNQRANAAIEMALWDIRAIWRTGAHAGTRLLVALWIVPDDDARAAGHAADPYAG
ncbi:MAG: hypothetical protein NT133_17370 [Alphaproteobacteria bacterium]|nr:hypothetical protein [Alphaproteobacteria bacterium]